MKVAISLPQDLFERAEALATLHRKSRSAFYAEALQAYLRSVEEAAITAKLNEVYSEDDPQEREATRSAIQASQKHYDKW